jgi:hypothetical protein
MRRGGFACTGWAGQSNDLTGIGGNAVYQSIQPTEKISLAGGGEGSQRCFVTVKGEFYGFQGSSSFTMESILHGYH